MLPVVNSRYAHLTYCAISSHQSCAGLPLSQWDVAVAQACPQNHAPTNHEVLNQASECLFLTYSFRIDDTLIMEGIC